MYYKKNYEYKNITLILIGINVFIFFIEMIAWNFMIKNFALIPVLISKKYYFWQFFTHMFLHGSIFHLFFNMFALFIFGFALERHWGSNKFLKYYIIAGLGGGLLHYFINPMSSIPSIGASGAVYGLLLAYGLTFPDNILYINFFIPIKAKYAVFIFGGLALLFGLTGAQSGIAHFAHLGGLITGLIYLKWDKWMHRTIKHSKNTRIYKNMDSLNRNKLKKRFDELMDKIAQNGYDALSEKEKTELDILSSKIYPDNK